MPKHKQASSPDEPPIFPPAFLPSYRPTHVDLNPKTLATTWHGDRSHLLQREGSGPSAGLCERNLKQGVGLGRGRHGGPILLDEAFPELATPKIK